MRIAAHLSPSIQIPKKIYIQSVWWYWCEVARGVVPRMAFKKEEKGCFRRKYYANRIPDLIFHTETSLQTRSDTVEAMQL